MEAVENRPPRWLSWVRPFVPPIVPAVVRWLRGGSDANRFEGEYPSWEAARQASAGYDDAAILARVRESAAKVRDGKAAFERDGVVFDRPEYNFPLLACLLRVASESGNSLRVLDFGGSLGSTYFQCRPFLGGLKELIWTVIEQQNFVDCGRREFEDGRLQFRGDIAQLAGQPVDVVLLSSVLPYLPEPYRVMGQMAAVGSRWLIVDRTPVAPISHDVITIQKVPASIYGRPTSYPCWIFSRQHWDAELARNWSVVCDVPGQDGRWQRDGGTVEFRFWFCRAKEQPSPV